MLIKAKVTEDHIRSGQRRRANACPVALALGEATGRKVLAVQRGFMFAEGPSPYILFPYGVAGIIQDFDEGRGMVPFQFEVEIPNAA